MNQQQDATARYAAALRALHQAAGKPTGAILKRQAAAQQPALKLSETSWSDWLNGKNVPSNAQLAQWVITYLAARTRTTAPDYVPTPPAAWEALRQQALTERRRGTGAGGRPHALRPARPTPLTDDATPASHGLEGLIHVHQGLPRHMGVHKPIDVPGATTDLPAYISRDIDIGPRSVRTLIRAAADSGQGGMVLLVGGSSAGKTRCAYEAITAEVPDWWLLHPDSADHIAKAAAARPARLVVWLDELQRYLPALTAATARRLMSSGAVLVGTLWPDRYTAYTTRPAGGQPDPYALERELVGLAEVIDVADNFTSAERARAQKIAESGDARITLALKSTDYGLTQVIAAAPQLIQRWRNAAAAEAGPYAAAVLNAAIDATRLGVRSPLTTDLLRAAAPGYCTLRQRATAPSNWFEVALAYATTTLNGAASALAPTAPPGPIDQMGQIHGYLVADYLQQQAGAERRWAIAPGSLWRALTTHLTDADDQRLAADAAMSRLLYCFAEPLFAAAADSGRELAGAENILHRLYAQQQLALLLHKQVDTDRLQARSDAGDLHAREQLALLLREQGDADRLRARSDAGDLYARDQLAELLREQGDADRLQARSDAGDLYARDQLAELLREQGDLDRLQALADADANTNDWHAYEQLVMLLHERGDLDRLQALADAGDRYALDHLAELLSERDDLNGLQALADAKADDWVVRTYLDALLHKRNYFARLQAVAETNSDAGHRVSSRQLAELLRKQGDLDQLQALADENANDWMVRHQLAALLRERGNLDDLQALADAGDRQARDQLVELLWERGDADELRVRALAGDTSAARHLVDALRKSGRAEEAERVRRFGLPAPE
ncbi:hypothetical protein [Acrocarpospora catenulata]|uniref:hypothetical protein n=1 Tax=Acrocarpospora catenulata TaxID=2836182 RepID=UPI001BDA57EB|nr:hypothetical protein [Acrocarpospora catenulata]